jgi:hypothetical protein
MQRLCSQAVSRPLEACQEHDVVQITTPGGVHEWLEVMQGWNPADQTCQLLWRGQLVQLAVDRDSSNMALTALGGSRGDWVPMHVCLFTSKRSASPRGASKPLSCTTQPENLQSSAWNVVHAPHQYFSPAYVTVSGRRLSSS